MQERSSGGRKRGSKGRLSYWHRASRKGWPCLALSCDLTQQGRRVRPPAVGEGKKRSISYTLLFVYRGSKKGREGLVGDAGRGKRRGNNLLYDSPGLRKGKKGKKEEETRVLPP